MEAYLLIFGVPLALYIIGSLFTWRLDKFLGSPKTQKPEAPQAVVAAPVSLAKSRAPGRAKAESQYTVTELLRRIQILQSANAGWEMIFEQLVPNNDAETKRLLNLLRGPHMFIPHVGLNVLEEECRTIAAHSPRAEWITAFRAAEKTMERLR